uniref:Small RNA 2'-O-methyltransferase n=1 Tax=Aceria tosichella TaxID=561515 RepID=A0A6G1SP12_9ACAR
MSATTKSPLSTQFYRWVQSYLERNQHLTSLTDVGCGNGRMLLWTKAVPQIEKINCIDTDVIILRNQMDRYFRPNLYEKLFGRQNSVLPVEINVFQGDIAVPDDRLRADCFTLIDMIEHLQFDHLENISRTIFGYYKPKSVIVSTPDPGLDSWAQYVCINFGYTCSIDHVSGLPSSESYGHTAQIIIFQPKPDHVAIQGDFACFDLLINKLSINEQGPEFLGDRVLRRICLMNTFMVPGFTANNVPTEYSNFDWSTISVDETGPQLQQQQQQCDKTTMDTD